MKVSDVFQSSIAATALLVLLICTGFAHAEDIAPARGLYFGALFGITTLHGEIRGDLVIERGVTGKPIETDPLTGGGLTAGVRGDWFAVEGSLALFQSYQEFGFDYFLACLDGKLLAPVRSRLQFFSVFGIASSLLDIYENPSESYQRASAGTDGLAYRIGLGCNLFLTRRLFMTAQAVYLWTHPLEDEYRLLSPSGPIEEFSFAALQASAMLQYTVTGMSRDPDRRRLVGRKNRSNLQLRNR